MNVKKLKNMEGIYTVPNNPKIAFVTKNLNPGIAVYGELLIQNELGEFREWVYSKSKLASGLMKNIRIPELRPGIKVLYLGASSGTTVSHVSDILGDSGVIYAIEFAPRPGRDLMTLANQRINIVPIIADARKPENYTHIVDGIDFLYCDVAQPNQAELFIDNAKAFLKKDGMGYIAIKTKSISQRKHPKSIFQNQMKLLEDSGFKTIKTADISKYHKHHFVYLGRWTKN